MTVNKLAEILGLSVCCGDADREISGVYTGDLLSWVMSRLTEGEIWITIMSNINVVAVASLADAAAVILAEGVEPDSDALETARAKGVTLMSSDLDAYTLCAKISSILEGSK